MMKEFAMFTAVLVLALVPPANAVAETSSRVATGTVIANRTVMLSTRIVGRITQVHAEEGDAVSEGQVIVEIDDAELQAQLRAARAARERADAELAHRKRVRNRLAQLATKNATSEEAIDEAEYAFRVAEANLKAADAEIDAIRASLAETRIEVPFDSVVIRKVAEKGLVTQPGDPLYEVQDQSRLKFRARVKERDLARIKPGDGADISITALGDKSFNATVALVIPSGDDRHTFIVELELPDTPGLYPGMFGKAVFR